MNENGSNDWVQKLDDEDLSFIKKFILSSGSLKEIAEIYQVTYPTVRLRLDRLIQKVKILDNNANDGYISLIKKMALEEKISIDAAKQLIGEYVKDKKREEKL